MGNGIRKLNLCFVDAGEISRRHDIAIVFTDSHLDEGLGHSYCYIRPDPYHISSSENHYEDTTTIVQKTTTFSCISGASVSANTSTPLSTALIDVYMYNSFDRASSFESSTSFASIPLQPVPRGCTKNTDVLPRKSMGVSCSGPIERGFLSGPIERGFVSGPIDKGLYSGSIEKVYDQLQRSYSHGGFEFKPKSKKGGLMKNLRRAIAKTLSRGRESIFAPIKGVVSINESDWVNGLVKNCENITVSSTNLSRQLSLNCDDSDEDESLKSQNLQWAQGKAGEDRVHIVISEKNGWVFVGIYDGFNGPDAPDFLLSNLYSAVHKELKGLLWNDKLESEAISVAAKPALSMDSNLEKEVPFPIGEFDQSQLRNGLANGCFEKENHPSTTGIFDPDSELKQNQTRVLEKGMARKSEESQRRWKCEWDRERLEHDTNSKDQTDQLSSNGVVEINHADVLKALSRALKKTEEAYLEIADRMVMENPELALMGSCVLAMLMKGDDVYLMNVGDSRAVLAQKSDPDVCPRKNASQDFERINQETLCDLQAFDGDEFGELPTLSSLQLTLDHSTNVKEEVKRIKREHLDDACAVMNDRVKGSLKVTRAFGAGFLKQPKWNNALLEMFRIDYIGTSPYINCNPSLYHHKLDVRDRFLILSSDGLYQYFTNEEAVSQVESFMASSPEGDPAQHLIEEVLFRAAKKAGMDFHELLEIPQGDRRKFHDDASIIIISLEGRIWRSSV